MRMVIVQRSGDRSPIDPPTAAELNRHRWHASRRGTVSFAGLGSQPTLPSVVAAEKFWKGEPGGVSAVLWSMVERAAIIAPALFLLGERKKLVRYTVGVTAAIEAVVLWQVKRQIDQEKKDV